MRHEFLALVVGLHLLVHVRLLYAGHIRPYMGRRRPYMGRVRLYVGLDLVCVPSMGRIRTYAAVLRHISPYLGLGSRM